jgi:hypothetical protein
MDIRVTRRAKTDACTLGMCIALHYCLHGITYWSCRAETYQSMRTRKLELIWLWQKAIYMYVAPCWPDDIGILHLARCMTTIYTIYHHSIVLNQPLNRKPNMATAHKAAKPMRRQ